MARPRISYNGGSTVIKKLATVARRQRAFVKHRMAIRPLYLQFGQWSMSVREFDCVVKAYCQKHPNGEVPFSEYWEKRG